MLEIWPNAGAGIILFYPGSMLAPGHYFTLVRAFLAAGFAVAGIHLSGHGLCREHFWRQGRFTFASLLEEGIAAEAWLRAHGYGPVAAAGHSQGAILALAHAGESATLAAGIGCAGVFPQMAEAAGITRFASLASRREEIMAALLAAARWLPWLPVPLPFYLDLGRVIAGRRKPLAPGRDRGRFSYPLAYLASLFAARPAMRLKCPFLLASARNDALFTEELTKKTFAAICAPFKELLFLPDGGHMAPYNPWLAQYLARHAAAFCAGLGFPVNARTQEKSIMPYAGLIAGLGNPGAKYAGTRHNLGFMLVDALLAQAGRDGSVEELAGKKFNARLWRVRMPELEGDWLAAEPQTFMNDSGRAIQPLLAWHGLKPSQLIVAHDEMDIPAGALRFKFGGGLAGHNGLASIAGQLGSKDFYRLRIGIGKPQRKEETLGWVLGRPGGEDRRKLEQILPFALETLYIFDSMGPERATQFAHGAAKMLEAEEE